MTIAEIDALNNQQLEWLLEDEKENAKVQSKDAGIPADWQAFLPKWLKHAKCLLKARQETI